TEKQRSGRRTLMRMLAAALVLRVVLGSFTDASGFDTDLMQSWTRTLLSVPLSEFYAVAEGPDHLPGDLWFLWAIGHGLELFGFENAPRGPFVELMKLVPAVADTVIAWELFVLLRSFATSRAALTVAAAFAFNPGAIFLTSIWGQWDALSMALLLGGALIILKAISLLPGQLRHPARSDGSSGRAQPLGERPGLDTPDVPGRTVGEWRGGALRAVPLWPVGVPLLAWAILIKPPLALVAGLFVLFACVRTFWESPAIRAAIRRTAAALILAAILGVVTALLIILPFDVGLPGMATRWSVLDRARYALDLYPFTTLQAANIWMIKDAHLYRPSDLDGTLLGLTERTWGSLLLAFALAWIAGVVVTRWPVVRASGVTMVVWAALAISYAIFMLPTRVHERYFFPVMVFALALAGLRAGRPVGRGRRRSAGHHRGVPYDRTSSNRAHRTWWLALAISGLFLVSLLIAYTPTVNAIRAAMFDVPLSALFRTLAIVNLGVFLATMALPLWWGAGQRPEVAAPR
ncbi:MAG TPA: hypothetical protein VGR08_13865, partial [Thermomicrobiales bacterium]|nr:hypothetical protein [Thermomicrobiales bacterium]